MEEAFYHAACGKKWALHMVGLQLGSSKTYKQFLHELATVEQNFHRMYGAKNKSQKKSRAVVTTSYSKATPVSSSTQAAICVVIKRLHIKTTGAVTNAEVRNIFFRNVTKARNCIRIMTYGVKYKSATEKISILKQFITDQSAHVNFLSNELCTHLNDNYNTCEIMYITVKN